MKQSNPIQQHMERMAEEWNETIKKSKARIVLYRVADNAQDMVEAFFDYMLATDTIIDDIAIHFHTPLHVIEKYSEELVNELWEMVEVWNSADKKDNVPFSSIGWKPDYTIMPKEENEYTRLFIKNINKLTTDLDLSEDILFTPILWLNTNNAKNVNSWMDHLIATEIHPQIKIIVTDTFENPLQNNILQNYPDEVLLVEPNFNMPRIMEQLAAMGNPADPETQYRLNFIKLANAVAERKDASVKEYSANCIQIALANIEKNPYWISQITTVYYTLGVYQMGLSKIDKAIIYAGKSLDAALSAKGKINDEMAFRNIGQAAMFRGSLYCHRKNWESAMADFQLAINEYTACKDYIMQIEAFRMKAYAAKQYGMTEEQINCLVSGAKLGRYISPAVAEASSYSLLLLSLLLTNYKATIPTWELDEIVSPLFGEDWAKQVVTSNTKDLELQA